MQRERQGKGQIQCLMFIHSFIYSNRFIWAKVTEIFDIAFTQVNQEKL